MFDFWAANTRAGMKLGQDDGRGCEIREAYGPE
ncbi:MAG: hypothetical protein RLZZ234_579 [Candidatus Parcubacteria bacterium]|jgi:hypothetical protein